MYYSHPDATANVMPTGKMNNSTPWNINAVLRWVLLTGGDSDRMFSLYLIPMALLC